MGKKSTSSGPQKKFIMWYEVQRLHNEEHLNISQIKRELGLDRGTIRHYLKMSESEFLSSESYQRQYSLKLQPYEGYVADELRKFPYLSSAQIEDKLKERYGENLKRVCSKTIFNFVMHIRDKYGIPKQPEDNPRQYEMQWETPYGEEAQVDFGERYMTHAEGGSIKVYFFVMVLCRSRYKFVYFRLKPFTTDMTIYAHELAFSYFSGIPKKVIYDQDKVLIKNENLGDVILTNRFRTFVSEHHFETVFCRKEDPESKGKVENGVRYVKHNFLSGREFESVEKLNSDGISWLERTGNGSVHGTTRRIPSEVFEEERKYLKPYYGTPTLPKQEPLVRYVRKDNVINYGCNYYQVPTGTYAGRNTCVYVEESDGMLNIFAQETGKTLASYPICHEKGKLIGDRRLNLDRTSGLDVLESKIREYVGDADIADLYMSKLQQNKGRYYRDNLRHIVNRMKEIASQTFKEAVGYALTNNIYNGSVLIETAVTLQKKKGSAAVPDIDVTRILDSEGGTIRMSYSLADLVPEKSNIKDYDYAIIG